MSSSSCGISSGGREVVLFLWRFLVILTSRHFQHVFSGWPLFLVSKSAVVRLFHKHDAQNRDFDKGDMELSRFPMELVVELVVVEVVKLWKKKENGDVKGWNS